VRLEAGNRVLNFIVWELIGLSQKRLGKFNMASEEADGEEVYLPLPEAAAQASPGGGETMATAVEADGEELVYLALPEPAAAQKASPGGGGETDDDEARTRAHTAELEEEEQRRERARAAWEAAAQALADELLEEVVLMEMLRTVYHAHAGVGRAGFKDAMEWLDPRGRAQGRKRATPAGSNTGRLLAEARKAAAGGDHRSVRPAQQTHQSNVFAELPNWSVKHRHQTTQMRGGGFVHLEEKDGSAQLAGSGGSLNLVRKGSSDRALIEVPLQPLADAEPWWRHLDKVSGGGLEAEKAHRLRIECGRPRRDASGTPDSLDTPPPSPPESPSPSAPSLLEPSLDQVEARMSNLAKCNPSSYQSQTFLTATDDVVMLNTTTDDMMLDSEGELVSFRKDAPPPQPPPWAEQKMKAVSPRSRPRPQTSIPTSAHRVSRYEKYMSEVMLRDGLRDAGDHSAKTPSDDDVIPSGPANLLFGPAGSLTTKGSVNKQRRAWCDRPRLLSSHRRVRERQVTVVDAETQKPCTGWGWGSRPPTEQVTASSCSLPILGHQSAKALVAAAKRNNNNMSYSSTSKIRPATAHVMVGDASHARSSVSRSSTATQLAAVGQAWRAPAIAMHTVRVLDNAITRAPLSASTRAPPSTAGARLMHSRGGVRPTTTASERLMHSRQGVSHIAALLTAWSRKGKGDAFPPASPKQNEDETLRMEIVGSPELRPDFFMDGHPSGW
jgi:hypothetical protein